MGTAKIVEAFDATLGGPDLAELEEAVALLCEKYGARIGFTVELPADARKEIIARFAKKRVRVHFQETLVPRSWAMLCERFGS